MSSPTLVTMSRGNSPELNSSKYALASGILTVKKFPSDFLVYGGRCSSQLFESTLTGNGFAPVRADLFYEYLSKT
jgi:hypothetical protein